MGKCIESSKKIHWSWNTVSQGKTGADGFLEHTPIRGSLYYNRINLQKIILFFSWVLPCVFLFIEKHPLLSTEHAKLAFTFWKCDSFGGSSMKPLTTHLLVLYSNCHMMKTFMSKPQCPFLSIFTYPEVMVYLQSIKVCNIVSYIKALMIVMLKF